MLNNLSALLLLTAMGAIGLAVLHRLPIDLDLLERVACGFPLGIRAGSLGLLLLAITLGFSEALVVGFALVCAIGTVLIWPGAAPAALQPERGNGQAKNAKKRVRRALRRDIASHGEAHEVEPDRRPRMTARARANGGAVATAVAPVTTPAMQSNPFGL
ncbi:MAG: hypothetical protein ACR2PL_01175 [Dehalococcoidia bacterium]